MEEYFSTVTETSNEEVQSQRNSLSGALSDTNVDYEHMETNMHCANPMTEGHKNTEIDQPLRSSLDHHNSAEQLPGNGNHLRDSRGKGKEVKRRIVFKKIKKDCHLKKTDMQLRKAKLR